MTKLEIPVQLSILASGVPGCVFEIIPRLTSELKSQKELHTFSENLMDTIGDHYTIPTCGSVMWFMYKNYCGKDLKKFTECIDTKDKQKIMMNWLLKNYS
jgi:hypothetical protein